MGSAEIHELAEKGWASGADAYERGRPDYPAAAADCLIEALRLDASKSVLDLGAGTGKLTRALARAGAQLVVVEPVEAMRRKLAASLPTVPVLAGTAEAIPLPTASVDAVAVGQAFHWFHGERALAEIHRVLRPRGRLGLIWNVRDESVPWIARLTAVVQPYRGTAPRYASGAWKEAFSASSLFTPLSERHSSFVHVLDVEGVLARVASISFIAALPPESRNDVLDAVRRLLASDPTTANRKMIEMPHRTSVFWCQRLS